MLKTTTSIIDASQIRGVLPVLHGGTGVTTKTGTGNVVLSAAPTLSGDVSLSTGNLVQGTAAKGVNFTANTPAAGMTSQLLNWYEEGTYNPTYQGSTSNPTVGFNVQHGNYTRIGNMVYFNVHLSLSSLSGGSGDLRVTLPFTTKTMPGGFANGSGTIVFSFQFNTSNPATMLIPSNANYFTMRLTPSDLSDLQISILNNPCYLYAGGWFFI
jgi:autotransporter-associated beta strand protein